MVQAYDRARSSMSTDRQGEQPELPSYGSNAERSAELGAVAAEETPWLAAAAGEVGAEVGGDVRAQLDTHEHIGVGGEDTVMINEVPFTTGQISAMPDFVRGLDVLYAMPASRLLEIRAALEQKCADPKSVDDARWQELFGDEYGELTFDNGAHFGTVDAVNGDLEGTNVGTWAEAHDEALALAVEAHRTGDAALADRALATEAWGSHYLGDAFSAGHLFDKDESVERAAEVGFVARKLLVGQAASRVFDQEAARISRYEVRDLEGNWRPFVRESFVLVMEVADLAEPRAFLNAPAGAIHDALSSEGVPVVNDLEPKGWTMMGDDHIDPESKRFAALAHERALQEVKDAATGAPSCRDVLGLIPRPTEDGLDQVEQTVERFHSEDGGLLDALVQQLGKQVELILDGAVEMKEGIFVRKNGQRPEPEPSRGPYVPEPSRGPYGPRPEPEAPRYGDRARAW